MGLKKYIKKSILDGAEISYTGNPEKVNIKKALKKRYNDSFKIPGIPCCSQYLEQIGSPYYLIIEAVPPIPKLKSLVSLENIGYDLLAGNVFIVVDKTKSVKYTVKNNPSPSGIPHWDNKWYLSVYDTNNKEIGGIKEITSLSRFFNDDLLDDSNGYKVYQNQKKICTIGETFSDGKTKFACSKEVKIKQIKNKQITISYDKRTQFILQPVNIDDAGLSNLIKRRFILEYERQEEEPLALLLGLTVANIIDKHTTEEV